LHRYTDTPFLFITSKMDGSTIYLTAPDVAVWSSHLMELTESLKKKGTLHSLQAA